VNPWSCARGSLSSSLVPAFNALRMRDSEQKPHLVEKGMGFTQKGLHSVRQPNFVARVFSKGIWQGRLLATDEFPLSIFILKLKIRSWHSAEPVFIAICPM